MSFKIRPITNNHYRSDIIRSVRDASQIDVPAEHRVAINEARRILLTLDEPFHQMIGQVQKDHYQLRRNNELKRQHLEILDMTIRDFMVGLKRLARRNKYPETFLVGFHLPGDQLTPKARPAHENMSIAQHLIKGDKDAKAAGYKPMANPSGKDLEKALTQAEKSCEKADQISRDYNLLRLKFAELRAQTDQAISNLAAYLRIAYRSQNPVERRNLMRTLGFRYFNEEDKPALLQNEPQATQPVHNQAQAAQPSDSQQQTEEKTTTGDQPTPSPVTAKKEDGENKQPEHLDQPQESGVDPSGIIVSGISWKKPNQNDLPNNDQSPPTKPESDNKRNHVTTRTEINPKDQAERRQHLQVHHGGKK